MVKHDFTDKIALDRGEWKHKIHLTPGPSSLGLRLDDEDDTAS